MKSETLTLVDQVEEQSKPLSHPTSALIKQVLAYLDAQFYAQPVTRKDIAAAVGVSENYLSRRSSARR